MRQGGPVTYPAGFLDPRAARAYRSAHRHATTLTERAYLDDLERCHRRWGKATPKVTGIAERIGTSTRTVVRITARLVDAGRIRVIPGKVHKRPDGTFRRTMTNLYLITFPTRKPWSHRGDTRVSPIACLNTDSAGAGSPGGTGPPPDTPETLFEPDADPPDDSPPPIGGDEDARRAAAHRTWRTAYAAARREIEDA
jgi:hypothetical protein